MSATIARLPSSEYPWVWALRFDYSPEMVEALKVHVYSRHRRWVPQRKEWWFVDGAIEGVRVLCMAYTGGYMHVEPEPGAVVPADAYAALHLLPTAPPELVRVAYKCLAKRCHPDKGGDVGQMQAINAAYDKLQLARSKERA